MVQAVNGNNDGISVKATFEPSSFSSSSSSSSSSSTHNANESSFHISENALEHITASNENYVIVNNIKNSNARNPEIINPEIIPDNTERNGSTMNGCKLNRMLSVFVYSGLIAVLRE